MSRISNQDIERNYFEQFRKYFTLPPGNIIYGDRPDIIIDGPIRVGIEITNFFIKEGSLLESEQIQRKLREKVVSKAQNIYKARNRKKIEISFGFDENNPIKNQNDLINKIVDIALKVEKFETGGIGKELFKGIPQLSFVYLNSGPYEDAKWRVTQLYEVPIMSRDQLINIVRDKENSAGKYKKCDVYWLLVVIDFINPAQDQDIINNSFEKIRTEVFEKVIVFKTLFGDILEAK